MRSEMHENTRNLSYELTRVADSESFYRKMRMKRRLYKWVGEIYVGKRAKLQYFKRWLRRLNLPANTEIIEIGSGDGVFAYYIAERMPQANVVGMELNEIEAQVCQRIADEENFKNLHFESGSLLEMKQTKQFDFAYCFDVLEHIENDDDALKEILGVLRPGASLLVHVPSRWIMQMNGELETVPDDEAWKINPGHVRNGYTPDELRSKIENAGFEVKKIELTQSKPMQRAHLLYARCEKILPLRILILPLLDAWINVDMKTTPTHGNTLWAWAKKPLS